MMENNVSALIIEEFLKAAPRFRCSNPNRKQKLSLTAAAVKRTLNMSLTQQILMDIFSRASPRQQAEWDKINKNALYAVEKSFGPEMKKFISGLIMNEYIRLIPIFGPYALTCFAGKKQTDMKFMLFGLDKFLSENLEHDVYLVINGGYSNLTRNILVSLLEDPDIMEIYDNKIEAACQLFEPEYDLKKLEEVDPQRIHSSFARDITALEFNEAAHINRSSSHIGFSGTSSRNGRMIPTPRVRKDFV